jgi:1,4-alpha-glucan branching enzyme
MKIKNRVPNETGETVQSAMKAAMNSPAGGKSVPQTKRITFSVRAEVGGKVFLAGDFNKWNPTAREMTDKGGEGVFTATLSLAPGDYQYKFVIDGTWCVDPGCLDWVQNEHGTLNSIKHVV